MYLRTTHDRTHHLHDWLFDNVALRTDDPLIIVEVEQGRSANDGLWLSLIAERRALGRKNTDAD